MVGQCLTIVPASDAGKKMGGSTDPDREAAMFTKLIATCEEVSVFPQFHRSRIVSAEEVRANAALIAAAPELLAGLKAILAGFDAGVWVRNISGDGDPAWAIKLMPHIQAMAAVVKAVEKAEGSEARQGQNESPS